MTHTAQAQQAKEGKGIAVTQQLEHCAMYAGGWAEGARRGYAAFIQSYRDTGIQTDKVEGPTTQEAKAMAFAKLGTEGWEMIGITNDGEVYFKRRKP